MHTLFTIGHSNHEIDFFLELLQAHAIDCVVDVRSIPSSQYNPQYNKKPLAVFLEKHSIQYMHFGKEFGARQSDPAVFDKEDRVDYERVQQTASFKQGVDRLKQGLQKGFKIALMCAEADPLNCHRFAMISVYLSRHGFEVKHILKDKSLVSQPEAEERLMEKYAKKLPKPNLFEPDIDRTDQLQAAYRLRNKDIGFKQEETS